MIFGDVKKYNNIIANISKTDNIESVVKSLKDYSRAEQSLIISKSKLTDVAKMQVQRQLAETAATNVNTAATHINSAAQVSNMTIVDALKLKYQELAASIGLSTTALTALIGVVAGVAIAAVVIEKINISLEEAQANLEKSITDFKNIAEEINSLNKELETTSERIEELQKLASNGTISLVEQNELDNLKVANNELERNIALLKVERAEKAKKVLSDLGDFSEDTVTSRYGDTRTIHDSESGEDITYTYETVSKEEELQRANEKYQSLLKEREKFEEKREELEAKGDNRTKDAIYEYVVDPTDSESMPKKVKVEDSEETIYQQTNERLEEIAKEREEINEYITTLYSEDVKERISAYKELTDAGVVLESSQQEEYNNLLKLQDAYLMTSYRINGIEEAYKALSKEQQRSVLEDKLLEDGLLQEQVSSILKNIKDEDLSILGGKGIQFKISPQDFTSVEEFGKAYAEAWLSEVSSSIEKTYTPFSEAFNATDFAEHKEKLLELAKAGELTPETLRSTKEYNTLLSETGLNASNAVEEINALIDATSRLSDMSNDISHLGTAYKEFKEDGYVNVESIEALRAKFGELKDKDGNDLFEEFANVVGSSETSEEDKQKAFNELATSYLIAEKALGKLTEQNKDYYITQLKSMGVSNADAIIDEYIETNKLLGAKQTLELQEEALAITADDFSEAAFDKVKALLAENNAVNSCRIALFQLAAEEQIFNSSKLDPRGKIEALIDLATAYGVASDYLSNAQKVIEGDERSGGHSGLVFTEADVIHAKEELYKSVYAETNFEIPVEFKIDDSGSSSKSSSEAKYDWIETKIEHLSSKAEKEAKKATDSIFAYISKKYKKSHLNSAISFSQEAISATREGKAYYEKERDKIGLPKEWADKVKYGAIDIDSDELKGKDELIKKIEEYQELTDKINGCTTTIEDLVSNIQEYAEQLANLPIEEAEKKIDKLTSKTDVLSAKYDNLNSYKAKNKNLDAQYQNAQDETKARKTAMNEANKYLKSTWKAEGMSIALSKSANKGKKFGDELSTDGLEVGSVAYNAVLKYNEALKASTNAQNEHALAVENETKILHDNTKAKYDNVTAYRSSLRSVREAQVSKAQAKLDNRAAKGLNNNTKEGKKVYQDMLKGQQAILTNYREERKKYDQDTLDKQYKAGELSFEEYKQLTAYISQLDEEILKSQADVLETQKILNEFKLTSLGNQIADAQRSSDKLGNELALKEKRWGEKAITKTDYNDQLSANKKLIGNYKDQNAELTKLRNKTEKYSDQWFEYQEQIDANNSSIQDLRLSNEDLKDSIRKLDYRPYENIREEVDKTVTTIEALIGLINDDSLFDDEGALTKLGTAKFSILGKELAETKESVASYVDQIEEINKKYKEYQKDKNNGYSVAEYEEEMNEATTGLYDLLSKSKSVTDAIISMHTQQQQIIIDALKEEISARSEAFQKKKEYYDYDKQIRTKTKDIEALEAQKAALEVTEDSLEKRRKLVELEAELTKQREELEETQKDHEINLVVNGLNDFSNDIQERFDDYTKKLSSSFEEQIKIIQNANQMYTTGFNSMAKTFNEVLSFYGVDTTAVNFKSLPGFATGGVIGGTSYNGDKLIARVNSGESILTQDFTDLLPHAVNVMQDLTKGTAPNLNHLVKVQPAINVSYDNLINIEGNATNETIVELKKLMPSITKQVTKSIKDDMKKSGY